ncbi:MAG: DUF1566 domain-containing protein [Prevotella sp.]|nr:DUF1566 domain-containing protein [Prevotella sp.]
MKTLRSIFFMIIALAITSVANAQELKVISFEKLLTDVTARSTAVKDGNGDVCALIKVSLPVAGCEFDGNIVDRPEFRISEYWVYMTPSSKKLIVRCPNSELLDVDFGTGVESAVTYRLKLSGYSTATGSSKNQPVTFKITPADAVLTIDQNEYPTQNGVAQVMLSPGEHAYVVVASGYNVQGSKFMVYENNNNKIIVELEAKTQTAGNLQPVQTNVSVSSNTINGHEYVDLGLPSGLKWATCNVGASSPSDYGDYFAWGETATKAEFTEETCKTWEKNLGDISGNPDYDAARANWGGSWRLPSEAELKELESKCTWTWTNQGGHNGSKVTGPNGNSIFLPAAGWCLGSSLNDAGDDGSYWSSTPDESDTRYACSLYFTSGSLHVGWGNRLYGRSVRPVSE